MKYRQSIDKAKGNKHRGARGNPTHYVNCQDCTAEERQKARRAQKWV